MEGVEKGSSNRSFSGVTCDAEIAFRALISSTCRFRESPICLRACALALELAPPFERLDACFAFWRFSALLWACTYLSTTMANTYGGSLTHSVHLCSFEHMPSSPQAFTRHLKHAKCTSKLSRVRWVQAGTGRFSAFGTTTTPETRKIPFG